MKILSTYSCIIIMLIIQQFVCENVKVSLKKPTILLSIISRNEEHALPTFLAYIEQLNYPKDRISILIQTDHNEDRTFEILSEWSKNVKTLYHQLSILHKFLPISYNDSLGVNHWSISRYLNILKLRQKALDEARQLWADYILFINSSEKMYDWCRQNIDGIHFQYISNDAVTLHCIKFKLEERYATCSTIPGTRNHHCFIPQSLTTLQMRRVSFDNVFTTVNISTMQQNYTIPLASLSPGSYIACVYDGKWFLGNIVEISEENQDILIKFMKQSISSNTFTWPHREDICWVQIMHVLCKISSLKVQSATGRCYELSAQEKTEIIHLYNSIFNNKII